MSIPNATKDSAKPLKIQSEGSSDFSGNKDGTAVIQLDPWLAPFAPQLRARFSTYEKWKRDITENEGSLDAFSRSYTRMGLHRQQDSSVIYREYAPGATRACLIGDFNNWELWKSEMQRDEFGFWTCTVPAPGIPHRSKVKISMITKEGERIDRMPAYIRYAIQDITVSPVYDAVFWDPQEAYQWVHSTPSSPHPTLKIYEAHVGISTSEGRIGTYDEFRRNVLPQIHALGYTAIQLMAIQEHAYYASFGYQVTAFFAASSRYGSPDDLKRLIDDAHGLGLRVLLDLVHSHACNNVLDGLNQFDGTDHCYFHAGPRGRHELWDSRLFNYGSWETLRFLLSNVRFFLDEYRFDGFRFDGVTSMMYTHHGIGQGFSGGYHEYFGGDVDLDAVVYLMLANDLIHEINPHAITVAEDVSGMPTLCRPVKEGGLGFDYRLAMAIPDMWIKMLKEQQDQEWDLGAVTHTLTNRRHMEATIAYAESHDQALVGDKTLAFWLMDAEMYTNMSDLSPLTPIIDRGLALHKMIRLITHALGGEAWLNFEGNEFGHPEWLDFPRAGNNDSYQHARRQWNLVDDQILRYRYLNAWDAEMQHVEAKMNWLLAPQAWVSLKHEADKVVVFERGMVNEQGDAELVWVFNFHPTQSYTDYCIPVNAQGVYKVALDTDEKRFGGHARIDHSVEFHTQEKELHGRRGYFCAYLPCRTAVAYYRARE